VVKELALDDGPVEQPCTVELVAGNGAGQAIAGAMEVLKPYVDKGAVTISAGTDVAACHTLDAAERIRELCSGAYADQELNAVLCLGEGQAEQVIEALKENYTGAAWPVVTGYGCNEELVANLASHMLNMVTYAEELTKEQLTEKAVALADASEEETEDSLIPCTAVTGSNYKELLVETGLYTAHKGGTFTKN
jgi:putative multiple sugar transport system substrate-binding protein